MKDRYPFFDEFAGAPHRPISDRRIEQGAGLTGAGKLK